MDVYCAVRLAGSLTGDCPAASRRSTPAPKLRRMLSSAHSCWSESVDAIIERARGGGQAGRYEMAC
jgi:hypothetical protein